MANIWFMAHNGVRSDQQHMTKVWLIWASLCLIFDQYPTNRPTNPPTKPRGPGGGLNHQPFGSSRPQNKAPTPDQKLKRVLNVAGLL